MKYEYKTLTLQAEGLFGGKVNNQDLEEQLNQLGEEGWELVNSLASTVSYGKIGYIISIFKRAIQSKISQNGSAY